MAILLNNEKYLKLYKNGDFIIYKSKVDRDLEKLYGDQDYVKSVYHTLLSGFVKEYFIDRLGYVSIYNTKSPDMVYDSLLSYDYAKLGEAYPEALTYLNKLEKEMNTYYNACELDNPNIISDTEIIDDFIEDVRATIPTIVERGCFPTVSSDTEEEAYNKLISGEYQVKLNYDLESC